MVVIVEAFAIGISIAVIMVLYAIVKRWLGK